MIYGFTMQDGDLKKDGTVWTADGSEHQCHEREASCDQSASGH